MNHSELTNVISELCKGETTERSRAFTDVIRTLEKNDEWVWQPVRDVESGGYTYCTIEMSGKVFIVMFSEDRFVKTEPGISLVSTAINRMIDCVLQENGPDGIAINPFTPGCHCAITKELLIPIIEGRI